MLSISDTGPSMHTILESIVSELDQLVAAVNSAMASDEPFNIVHGNWTFPGVSKSDLVDAAQDLADLIRESGTEFLGDRDKRISDYPRRLAYLRTSTVPNMWGNAAAGVPSFFATLDALRRVVLPALKTEAESADEARRATASVLKRVRSMESRLNEFEPRSAKVADMVERIELAHDAADQLPADLEQVTEDRTKIAELLKGAEADQSRIVSIKSGMEEVDKSLNASAKEAEAVLSRCESAYSAATSQGLAAAFSERSEALDRSMWTWVVGLIIALGLGAYFGSQRLHELVDLMKNPSLSNGSAILNLMLAALSVGAPIWFGWLATKQIGQRFRLSEDYAFKASVSRAYEGYRREAARVDKDMETSLLASALARLDEQPLRFVEHHSHGSPWHELASSELVKTAMKSVPGFVETITAAAKVAAKEALGVARVIGSADKQPVKPEIVVSAPPAQP
jgi:hypothetical protein